MFSLGIQDLIVTPIVLLLILMRAYTVQAANIIDQPCYKYYIRGLVVKIIGSIGLCLAYLYVYKAGDTLNFFYYGGNVFTNVFLRSPIDFLKVLFGPLEYRTFILFDSETGFPYYHRDPNSYFVIRLIAPLTILCFKSYLATSIMVAWIAYWGVWRLLLVFVQEFPKYTKQLTWGILFIPSVAFWGSGVLKDTFTLAAVGWYVYALYNLVSPKSLKPRWHFFAMFGVSIYILISLKPYIFFGLFPGTILWLSAKMLSQVKGQFIKVAFTPMLIGIFAIGSYTVLNTMSSTLGKYSVNEVLERAVITQRDLKNDIYGGSSFDIGEFEATPTSMLAKAPQAIAAGLFRPFIYEANNAGMILSGFENTFLLFFFFFILFRSPWLWLIETISQNSLLKFSLIFILFFSFSVGISTSNFGSLVRYRIPLEPFFLSFLFLINELRKDYERDREKLSQEAKKSEKEASLASVSLPKF